VFDSNADSTGWAEVDYRSGNRAWQCNEFATCADTVAPQTTV